MLPSTTAQYDIRGPIYVGMRWHTHISLIEYYPTTAGHSYSDKRQILPSNYFTREGKKERKKRVALPPSTEEYEALEITQHMQPPPPSLPSTWR